MSARGALAMMPCPCVGRRHGSDVLWVAGLSEKHIFEICYVNSKIGPLKFMEIEISNTAKTSPYSILNGVKSP